MKLYTKTGDDGSTGLFGGGRVSKASIRVVAYGEVDELNSALGYALSLEPWDELTKAIRRVQGELFDLGANLAVVPDSESAKRVPTLGDGHITWLEAEIDRAQSAAPTLDSFILPGGARLASWLFVARAICRRAERSTVLLADHQEVPNNAIMYLNRLGDLLFAWARESNARSGAEEPKWQPGSNQ